MLKNITSWVLSKKEKKNTTLYNNGQITFHKSIHKIKLENLQYSVATQHYAHKNGDGKSEIFSILQPKSGGKNGLLYKNDSVHSHLGKDSDYNEATWY